MFVPYKKIKYCNVCKKAIENLENAIQKNSVFYCDECFWEKHFVCINCGNIYHNNYMNGDNVCTDCKEFV